MNLVLGNASYRRHMTDEGDQLQMGLVRAGWRIAGRGWPIDDVDVRVILDKTDPARVLVQAQVDWDPRCGPGVFDPTMAFHDWLALARWGAWRTSGARSLVVVVKDLLTVPALQRQFLEEVMPDAVLTYHAEPQVRRAARWLEPWPFLRTYHTVDPLECPAMSLRIERAQPRRRALISGARNAQVYPVRELAYRHAAGLGLEAWPHPGYHADGAHTGRYLSELSKYRVSVATASRYGLCLRKIIESVAVGCTPVTDLPADDVLPMIDAALVRVPPGATLDLLAEAIDRADRAWKMADRLEWARLATAYYDWRVMGERLAAALEAA